MHNMRSEMQAPSLKSQLIVYFKSCKLQRREYISDSNTHTHMLTDERARIYQALDGFHSVLEPMEPLQALDTS